MAVTINSLPSTIALAKNNMQVELESDNFITTDAETAFLDILVNTKDGAEDLTFRLQWDDNDITFTSKDDPDDSGTQFESGSLYGTISEWLVEVASWLSKNEALNDDFYVYSSGDHLYFSSYEQSADYTLTFTTSDFDWSVDDDNDGVDEVRSPNFSLTLSLHIFIEERLDYLSNNYDYYEKVKTWEVVPLDDSTAQFNIDSVLRSYFPDPQLPTFGSTSFEKDTSILLRYHIRYAEKFGTPPERASGSPVADKYALNGGMNRRDFEDEDFYSDLITGSSARFLTFSPNEKRVLKDQHDYLYLIQTFVAQYPQLYVRYTAVKEDGTSDTSDVNFSNLDALYDVHIIPVGHNYVSTLFSSDLKSYTVSLIEKTGATSVLSEVKNYKVVRYTPLNAKYYLYRNSLGAFESIWFTGEAITGVAIDRSLAKRILRLEDGKEINENLIYQSSFTTSKKLYTGFKSTEELNAFIDFLNSEHVYEQSEDGYYKPVTVDTKKVQLYSDVDKINSASINIIDQTEKNYSDA